MTDNQKRKRKLKEEELRKAPPKAVEMSVYSLFTDFFNLLKSKHLSKTVIKSDENKAYVRAFNRIDGFSDHFEHVQYSSKAFCNTVNPLFPANYVDVRFGKIK